ncbi:hypothetical protein YTPLAS18_18600 [Nitrospira sp.]|nr:hypothetical protein YTPLAS18_18600 [Nitrospira sp.]
MTDAQQAGTIFQTPAWLAFLTETQQGELVLARLKDGDDVRGLFAGVIVNKYGVRILGSPFPGWSTDYMGLMLSPGVVRRGAIEALMEFAFHQLGCLHFEMMDRQITETDLADLGVRYRLYRSFEVDLSQNESDLFSKMTSACRRCIRKAEKEGVFVEEAHDSAFADEYYAQLQDVFAKQALLPTYGIERVRRLIYHLQPIGQLLLLRARDRTGRCIATGIFPYWSGVMYFWGGASWRHSQCLRPNEVLQWHAMRIGKSRDIRIYDLGGGGEYKRKYGGADVAVPWFHKSKYGWVRCLREWAERGHKIRREGRGQLVRLLGRSLSRGEQGTGSMSQVTQR